MVVRRAHGAPTRPQTSDGCVLFPSLKSQVKKLLRNGRRPPRLGVPLQPDAPRHGRGQQRTGKAVGGFGLCFFGQHFALTVLQLQSLRVLAGRVAYTPR